MKFRNISLALLLPTLVFTECVIADVENNSDSNLGSDIGEPFSVPIIEENVNPFQELIDLIHTPQAEIIEMHDEAIAPVPDILFTDLDELEECTEIIMGPGCGGDSVDTDGDGLFDELDFCPTQYGNPVDGCDYSEQYEGEENIS